MEERAKEGERGREDEMMRGQKDEKTKKTRDMLERGIYPHAFI
jgi:hypothetical protein